MNKRRRVGRGAHSLEALKKHEVADKQYTFQRFKFDQNVIYERKLKTLGLDFEYRYLKNFS